MGCPKEFSLKGGMGAALLTQPEKIREVSQISLSLFLYHSLTHTHSPSSPPPPPPPPPLSRFLQLLLKGYQNLLLARSEFYPLYVLTHQLTRIYIYTITCIQLEETLKLVALIESTGVAAIGIHGRL